MKIGIDIMGGDYAPKKTVHGAILALEELPENITDLILHECVVGVVNHDEQLHTGDGHVAKHLQVLRHVQAAQVQLPGGMGPGLNQ